MIYKKINLRENAINGFMPTLTTYILDDPMEYDRKRGAVLICPGGGYKKCSKREAEPIALKFNSAGYHAFVLDYCVAPIGYPEALKDVSKAMSVIRENADEWYVEPDKISVCGFSAGGHLAASLAVFWDNNIIKVENELNKPNALILAYPVITSGEFAHKGSFENLVGADEELSEKMSLEKQINSKVPPTFIWHTFADKSVPVENTLLFSAELRKNDIPFELHVYPKGGHGLSLATKEVSKNEQGISNHVATWMNLAIEWLDDEFCGGETL